MQLPRPKQHIPTLTPPENYFFCEPENHPFVSKKRHLNQPNLHDLEGSKCYKTHPRKRRYPHLQKRDNYLQKVPRIKRGYVSYTIWWSMISLFPWKRIHGVLQHLPTYMYTYKKDQSNHPWSTTHIFFSGGLGPTPFHPSSPFAIHHLIDHWSAPRRDLRPSFFMSRSRRQLRDADFSRRLGGMFTRRSSRRSCWGLVCHYYLVYFIIISIWLKYAK